MPTEMYAHLDVSLLSLKSWSRANRRDIGQYLRHWGKRFSVQRDATPAALSAFCHANDWIVLPATRANFGTHASHALACGAAVIANQIDPYSEIIEDGVNGFLVRRDTQGSVYEAWLDASSKLFSDIRALLHLQTQDWKIKKSKDSFERVW